MFKNQCLKGQWVHENWFLNFPRIKEILDPVYVLPKNPRLQDLLVLEKFSKKFINKEVGKNKVKK